MLKVESIVNPPEGKAEAFAYIEKALKTKELSEDEDLVVYEVNGHFIVRAFAEVDTGK